MSSKLAKKLSGMRVEVRKNPAVPQGTLHCHMTERDTKEAAEEVKADVGPEVWEDFIGKAGKTVTAASVVEAGFKASALGRATLLYGHEEAGEMLKTKLGVSGSSDSYEKANKELRQSILTLDQVQRHLDEAE